MYTVLIMLTLEGNYYLFTRFFTHAFVHSLVLFAFHCISSFSLSLSFLVSLRPGGTILLSVSHTAVFSEDPYDSSGVKYFFAAEVGINPNEQNINIFCITWQANININQHYFGV